MNPHLAETATAVKPAFMYLPACLISQTGGLSTFSPLTALSRRGSAIPATFGAATDSAERKCKNQLLKFITISKLK